MRRLQITITEPETNLIHITAYDTNTGITWLIWEYDLFDEAEREDAWEEATEIATDLRNRDHIYPGYEFEPIRLPK